MNVQASLQKPRSPEAIAAIWHRLAEPIATIKDEETRAQYMLAARRDFEAAYPNQFRETARAILAGGANLLKVSDAGDWAGIDPPAMHWLLADWIPMGRSTYLTGEGGTGKSLLAQQIATHIALGLPFLGKETRQLNVLYLTCEDDLGELQRRQRAICSAARIDQGDLQNRLFMLSRRGELVNSLIEFDGDGHCVPSPFYADVRHTCENLAAPVVILDNVAHLFDGNENIRFHVASFCNLMEKLATEIGGAVIFLGHPAKSGAQFSGSTAWENQVRTRLYLERAGEGQDPDLRSLQRSKANYARSGESIEIRWQEGAFALADSAPPASLSDIGQAANENARFLELLDRRIKDRRSVSDSKNSQTFAPKEFAAMPAARGMKAPQFAQAMERLFELGEIEKGELWKGADRKPVVGLRRKNKTLRDGSDNLRDGSQDMAENCDNPVRDGSEGGECLLVRGSPPPPPIGGESGELSRTGSRNDDLGPL